MTVNFISQLDTGHGLPRYLNKHYFWVCLWQCFQEVGLCIGGLRTDDVCLQWGYAPVSLQVCCESNRTKRWRRVEFWPPSLPFSIITSIPPPHLLFPLLFLSLEKDLNYQGKFWFSFFCYKSLLCSFCVYVCVCICVHRKVSIETRKEHWNPGDRVTVMLSTWEANSSPLQKQQVSLPMELCLQPWNPSFQDFRIGLQVMSLAPSHL